ncbi:MAG TPA: methyltransferase domain-containing protein [Candidatus Acidoferrales bacterium]|nr:methyltransferase domain-containing protein [Candidatus Acidoferrales bacterium]
MAALDEQRQKDLVRDRFTRTAEVFGDFVLKERAAEADKLAGFVEAASSDRAVDLACGPGTLALRFARLVRWICGFDLTQAMLVRARATAKSESIANVAFSLGDAQSLPFARESLDLAVTSYSLHHIPDPARVIREMARVVKRGGRVGVLDIRVPENPRAAEISNQIERLRDPSHTRTLARSEFVKLFAAARLHVTHAELEEHPRSFDHWMSVAGWRRGDEAYENTRRLMESTISGDAADFHPRYAPPNPAASPSAPPVTDDRPDIQMVNTALYTAAVKV